MELIDKEKIVTELYRLIFVCNSVLWDKDSKYHDRYEERKNAHKNVLDFINTLETKEVDLKEDVDRILYENDWDYDEIDFYEFAKHFFELGLKASDWREERMKECPYRQVGCTMYSGTILECRGACSWVVDYPKLKQLEEKKGE